jgi:hypothetical protein
MTRCECGSVLETLPEDDELYCPRCEPSRRFGAGLDDDIPVTLGYEGEDDQGAAE